MKREKLALVVAMAGILSFTAVGCSGGEGEAGGGELEGLTVAVPSEASSFDPVITTEVPSTELIRNVFETLLTQDSKGSPTPMLAESYKQSPDNMTLTFQLRHGVKFHDGTTMDADDVVASMKRWLKYSAAAQASFKDATMEKVNDDEVVLKLASPNSAADLVLSYSESSIPLITPKEEAEKAGGEPMTEYIGTGPFEFVAWNKGQNLELKRFEDYSALDSAPDGLAGNRTPAFDSLTYEFTPDPSTEIAGLQSGTYDVAETIPYDYYDQLEADGSLDPQTTDRTALPNLYFNKSAGLFSDVKARQALAIGLDRESLLKGGYGSEKFYDIANGCMMPESLTAQWPCDKSNQPDQPDPEQAKTLLKEAGYKGEKVRIITSRDSGRAYQVSTVLQQQLKDLGIDAQLETFDYATLNSKRAEKDAWELIVINNIAKVEPLQQFYIPADNPGWTDQDELAPIIADYQGAASPEERQAVYMGDMQDWYSSYIPVVNLGSASDLFATRAEVQGVQSLGSSLVLWTATAR